MDTDLENAPITTCIVGNCPAFIDRDGLIDQFAWVTRFNNTAGFEAGSGSKISELVLVSRGGQAREWLDDPGFVERNAIKSAQTITLVFPKTDDPGAECCFGELQTCLSGIGKTVTCLSEADHRYAGEALRALGATGDAALSSGFVYTHSRLRALPAAAPPVHIFGFSFEGWDGHAWTAEKAWFAQSAHRGRLILHPLDSGDKH